MSVKAPPVPVSRQARYLQKLSEGYTKKASAEAAGIDLHDVKKLRDVDGSFRELERVAYEEVGRDALVEVARCRAVDGWDEVVVDKNGNEHRTHKHDSVLLMFLIKQRDPSFRENAQLQLTGPNGGAAEVKVSLDFPGVLAALEQAGVVRRGPSASVDAALGVGSEPAALLSARADGAAGGGADSAQVSA